jgi:2-C-methyl-D-erythritol 2,4-cyclodiphosphate synthase
MKTPRIGHGLDIHRLEGGDGLVIGGAAVACDLRAVAHSDGDALLHAVTDAVLGALGEDDLGTLFPDSEERNRNRPSADFLEEALRRMRAAGYQLASLDATLLLERPRIGPHRGRIRSSLADLCGVETDRVNCKAKTAEALGPVGRSEAMAAEAVVLLVPRGEG